MSVSKLREELEDAIKKGRLDIVKDIIQSECINASPPVDISHPDWSIVWLAIHCGQLDILKFFVEKAHIFRQPKVDFQHRELKAEARKANPDIKQYFDLFGSLTEKEFNEVLESVVRQRKSHKL